MLAASMLGAAAQVQAQSQQIDPVTSRTDEDYSRLLAEATQGREPVVERQAGPTPAIQAPVRTAAERQVEKPVRVSKPVLETETRERPGVIHLHDRSEYADEEHPVRIVDRSGFDDAFLPTTIPNSFGMPAGAIVIDTKHRQLYFAMSATEVRRYGVAVGKQGAVWHGQAVVGRKAKWPDWHPTANIRRENRRLKARVAGGASNPLGARAIYLFKDGRDTLYRIHGTTSPKSIGTYASHGCIRMINEDVIELYSMVKPGALVVVK
jgi:lipoprotein-anchoring transpeptidase ErfK/SrfK